MKPAAFQYFAPASIEEALSVLRQYGEQAKILAGGQSLVPMMNFRLVRPKCLIDINRIASLSYIAAEGGTLCIGAATRQRSVEKSALVREKNGLLQEAVRLIGHPAIRARGTVGGSIVHADPTAELPTILAALDGEIRVLGPRGPRTIAWRDLFVTYFTTSIEPDEICTEVVLPTLPPQVGWAFEEFTPRHGDFSLAGVAAVLETDSQGKCSRARLAVAGAGATPIRAFTAEEFLQGQILNETTLLEAGRRVSEQVDPDSDLHATAEYRRHLACVMAVRALKRARQRLHERG